MKDWSPIRGISSQSWQAMDVDYATWNLIPRSEKLLALMASIDEASAIPNFGAVIESFIRRDLCENPPTGFPFSPLTQETMADAYMLGRLRQALDALREGTPAFEVFDHYAKLIQ